ncbi:MAG: hypothetical protein CME21_14970 [Gemmatimonadetes bacterium]|nr:hypothetical protein [Gemmatimonadota bacterium]
MPRVLFICTGNIFRSMIAEYALKAQVLHEVGLAVASAGIQAKPMEMYGVARDRLIELGVDPTGHVQRRLTGEILEGAGLPVAMSVDHQAFVHETFDREVPLFNRVCYGRDEPLLDLGEKLPDWQANTTEAETYVRQMVDRIWEAIPHFKANLTQFLPRSDGN